MATAKEDTQSPGPLDRIIWFALRHRKYVLAFGALMLLAGGLVAANTPIDVLPDISRPIVSIVAEGHGRAAAEVELQITIPLETALLGAPGLTVVRSTSKNGVGLLDAEFREGTEIFRARQVVTERMMQARHELPADVAPALAPTSSLMGEILLVGLLPGPEKNALRDLRTWTDWVLRRRLLTLPGISNVTVIGGHVAEYQIRINDRALLGYDISPKRILERIEGLGRNGTGGFTTKGDREFVVRSIAAIYAPEEIGATVIGQRAGFPVRLRDVATIENGSAVRRGDAGVNGHSGIVLAVQKQPGASTMELTARVDETLASVKSELPAGATMIPGLFRQADFIERAVGNVLEALRDGTVIVALVLIVFLWSARATIITLTAIPLSLIAALLVLRIFGLEINTMTLGGLAIAIGELVDDAIVDVENIFRRLKDLNPAERNTTTILATVYSASAEIRKSIVLATLVVIVVFLPIALVGGVEGKLLWPLAVAYITAIVASLVVALTVTPVLAFYLLPSVALSNTGDSALPRALKRAQSKYLGRLIHSTWPSVVILSACVVLSLAIAMSLPREFMPPFNEGTITIEAHLPTGTALDHTVETAGKIEEVLLKHPSVASISRRTGRSERDDHAEGAHYSEFDVTLKSGSNRAQVAADLRQALRPFESVAFNFGQPISHRVDHLLTGIKAEAGVFFFGPDTRVLVGAAFQARAALEKIPGLVDLVVETAAPAGELKIAFDFDRAARLGVSVPEASRLVEQLLNGVDVGTVIEGKRTFAIRARLNEDSRQDPARIQELLVGRLPSGFPIRLGDIADIYESDGPTEIKRLGGIPRIVLQFNIEGRDSAEIMRSVETTLRNQPQLPAGYHYELGGRFKEQARAFGRIGIAVGVSLLLTALIVFSGLRSALLTTQVLLNLPAALAGGLAALAITGTSLNIASLVGFIALGGIAVRNGILMISHFLHLMEAEGEEFTKEMILRGARERLAPVLMTAATAVLALFPILAGGPDAPGKEMLFPVALVISGGLFTSTLLDLTVTPVLFFRITGRAYGKKIKEALQ